MNDTTRRFIDALLERIDESRIVEVRLFPPIRQGGMESGVAVLAVEPLGEPVDEFGPPVVVVDEVIEAQPDGDSADVSVEDLAVSPTQELPAADIHFMPTIELAVPLEAELADAPGVVAKEGDLDEFLFDGGKEPLEIASGPERLAILCASYKLTVKGVDRGKWEVEVIHHADAPLGTLDNVIRGVVRRSGDDAEPERFTRQSLRDLLDAPSWATEV